MPEPLSFPGHLPAALPLSRSVSSSSSVGTVGGLCPPLAVFSKIQSLRVHESWNVPPRGLSPLLDASMAG